MMMYRHMGHGRRAWWPARIATMVLVGILAATLFALLFGIVVQALWNWLMPPLFGLGTVTFWQAFGLVLLGKFLFGGFGGGRGFGRGRGRHWRVRGDGGDDGGGDSTRGDEGRGGWGPAGGNWHAFREYWHAEGRQSFEEYLARKAGGTPVG